MFAAALISCRLPGGGSAEYLYVTNQAGNSVSAYSIQPDSGALIPVAGSSCGTTPDPRNCFPTGSQPAGIAASPNGKYLYVSNEGTSGGYTSGTISAYSIDPTTGRLQSIFGASCGTTPDPHNCFYDAPARNLTITPDGAHLYALGSTSISGYSIDPDTGALLPISASSCGTTPDEGNCVPDTYTAGQGGIAVDHAGKFLYTVNTNVAVYTIDSSTGALGTNVSGFNCGSISGASAGPNSNCFYGAGTGAQSVVISPNGGFLYISDGNFSNQVYGYALNATTGVPSAISASAGNPFSTGKNPLAMAMTPDGAHLYVANYLGQSISANAVGTDGALTPITTGGAVSCSVSSDPANCFTTGSGSKPSAIVVHPNGKYLYVPDGSNGVSSFKVASDGSLSPITIGTHAAGNAATSAVVASTSW